MFLGAKKPLLLDPDVLAAIGRGQKGNEAAVDLFACRGSGGGCGVGVAGKVRTAWTYARWMTSVSAKGYPAVRCRGVSAALVTSTTPADPCGAAENQGIPSCGGGRCEAGAGQKPARAVTNEGVEFIAVALGNEGVLGEADAYLLPVQEIDADEGRERDA
ncbi:hypothetical protein ACSSS7_004974 [Eimeria intestinalis]